jgi:proteasome lid subunit RPN8/RPN11
VIIPRRVLLDILEHARAEQPRECCGVLIGRGDEIVDVTRAKNLHASATRYEIDPRDHFHAIKTARARGLSIVGFYHSHPHSLPYPSATDRSEATADDVLYVIVGIEDGEWRARAFSLRGGAVEERALSVQE